MLQVKLLPGALRIHGMNKKQLILACVTGVLLLSGCAKFRLTKEGGRFTVPFDFPQEKKDPQNSQKVSK